MRKKINYKRPTAQLAVTILRDGIKYVNLTRWLPSTVNANGMIISINDDFSILVAGLEKAGTKYFIKKNLKGQRALFVEQSA